jgi:hypothetical protein
MLSVCECSRTSGCYDQRRFSGNPPLAEPKRSFSSRRALSRRKVVKARVVFAEDGTLHRPVGGAERFEAKLLLHLFGNLETAQRVLRSKFDPEKTLARPNENPLYSISLGVASLQVIRSVSPLLYLWQWVGHFKFLFHQLFVGLGLTP